MSCHSGKRSPDDEIAVAQQSFFYPCDSFMLLIMTIKIRVANLSKVGNPGRKEGFHFIFKSKVRKRTTLLQLIDTLKGWQPLKKISKYN